jgi:predicted DCC family thiol-disulfide oxidoreductase YuxK
VSEPPAVARRSSDGARTPHATQTRIRATRRAFRSEPLRRLTAFWVGEIDLAPLALFRIVFGLLLFNWFWQLYPNFGAFFTDEGMLPRRSLLEFHPVRITLLNAVGEWWAITIFWIASLVIATMVTIGYRTRLACVLAFVAVSSFQWRNPLILDGSDFVFRPVPLWLAFAASGERFSLDAALRRARGDPVTGRGWALPVRLLEIQYAWIYLATGLEKLAGPAWRNGTATYFALQLKHTFGRAWADFLVRDPLLVRAQTWGTLFLELAFLPLVFAPVLQRYARLLAVALAAGLHVGIALFMNVGNFPIVMLAGLLLFLPPTLATRLAELPAPLFRRSRVRFLYDGRCARSAHTARLIAALDGYGTVEVVDAQSDPQARGQLAKTRDHSALLAFDERGGAHTGFAAVATAGRGLPLLAPLTLLCAVPALRTVAAGAHRSAAARGLVAIDCDRGDRCDHATTITPFRERWSPRWLRPIAGALLVGAAAAVFATAMPSSLAALRPPEGVHRAVLFTGLDQQWNMFSPDPASSDGWMLAPARLADGTEIDLFTGRAPDEGPRYADPLYSRWAKVVERISSRDYTAYRLEFGRMFCRMRNLHLAPGQVRLETFELKYIERVILPPETGGERIIRHDLWSHVC